MGTQNTIIYRLMLTNPGFGPYLPFYIFGPKKGARPHMYPYESGASKPHQVVDSLGGPYGSPVISKSCFKLF